MKMLHLSCLRAMPLLLLLLGSPWTGAAFAQASALSYVEYQGQRIQLSRAYVDFDEYKEDVKNISSKQALQVEAIMRKVRFGPSFASGQALDDALFKLQFPGYGMFYANPYVNGPDGRRMKALQVRATCKQYATQNFVAAAIAPCKHSVF